MQHLEQTRGTKAPGTILAWILRLWSPQRTRHGNLWACVHQIACKAAARGSISHRSPPAPKSHGIQHSSNNDQSKFPNISGRGVSRQHVANMLLSLQQLVTRKIRKISDPEDIQKKVYSTANLSRSEFVGPCFTEVEPSQLARGPVATALFTVRAAVPDSSCTACRTTGNNPWCVRPMDIFFFIKYW